MKYYGTQGKGYRNKSGKNHTHYYNKFQRIYQNLFVEKTNKQKLKHINRNCNKSINIMIAFQKKEPLKRR